MTEQKSTHASTRLQYSYSYDINEDKMIGRVKLHLGPYKPMVAVVVNADETGQVSAGDMADCFDQLAKALRAGKGNYD